MNCTMNQGNSNNVKIIEFGPLRIELCIVEVLTHKILGLGEVLRRVLCKT